VTGNEREIIFRVFHPYFPQHMPEGLLYFPSKIKQFVLKESLNRDSDQFHRYQQNEHSTFTIAELTDHNNKKDHDIPR
jgi:hypothetical protein